MIQYVWTGKRKMAHVLKEDGSNSVCGAHPSYYGRGSLIRISPEKAREMHFCMSCRRRGHPSP